MVCDDVRRVVYFFLDDQLGERKLEDLRGHLKDCRNCDDRVAVHKRLRDFIRRRLHPLSAPGPLRTRIHEALRRSPA